MKAGQTHVHKFCGEFEGGRFEAEVFGGAGQDEAEVDVDDVTFRVQQDVPVMPERTAEVRTSLGSKSGTLG